jgi:DHA2 family multidrug resistance protein
MAPPAKIAAASPSGPPAARPKVNKWLVTISITFGTLMGTIDASIVNVALPHMRGAVGATVQEITWISTGFALANVLVMPLTAFLGRLFGQKRVYMSCLVLFVIGSALCGTARTLPALITWRALQGLGAGALQPTEQAILRQTFSPQEQGMAMALFAIAVMMGPAIGPTLGGYIVDNWSWPWIFFINLPVGLIGLVMVANFVHEDPEILASTRELAEQQRKHMDWAGIALLCTGLGALQYGLEEGARDDWFESPTITAVFIVGAIGIAAFIIRELTATAPAVNIRLFKDRAFLSGTVIGAVMFAMLMANMFLLPLFMQELLGFNATQAGFALMPRVLIMMVATPIVGRLYNYVDPRILISIGVVFFCYGAVELSHLTLQSGSHDVIMAITIQGVGFSCLFVPLTTTALASIPKHLMPDATGLNALMRQIGGSIGLAAFATLLGDSTTRARESLTPHIDSTSVIVQQRIAMMEHAFAQRGMDALTAHHAALESLAGMISRQAATLAFERIFLLAGILFLVVLPLLFFLKVVRVPATAQHAEAHLEV